VTVLVTGASSRIGQSVVAALDARVQLVLLVNRRPAPASGPRVRTLAGGLAAAARHAAVIQSADVVLHMAGLSHARRAQAYAEVNEDGTLALLAACRPAQPIVYLSTRCAGPDGGAYGRSKHRAEQAIAASGRPYVIIRPSEVYGSQSGEGIDALVDLAIRRRVLLDFRWRPPVRYSPVACDELAGFVARVVASDLSNAAKTYTICNNRSYAAEDIRGAIERGLGKPVHRVPIPVGLLKAMRAVVPLPFAPDQIERLIMDKPADNRLAREDYAFSPRCFLQYLEERRRLESGRPGARE